jgi:hypothetical protein
MQPRVNQMQPLKENKSSNHAASLRTFAGHDEICAGAT